MSKKDWRKIFNELAESLERVTNLDPDAKVLGPFVEFLDDLNAEERKEVFRLMGDDLVYLATAISDGDLTPEEVNAFLAKFSAAVDEATGNSSLLVNKLGELRDEFGELVSVDIDPNKLFGTNTGDVLGITSAIEKGKVILTPDQQFKNNTATLATNTGNLVTSTDTLKGSIDTLNSTISSRNNGLTNIGFMPWMPPGEQGAGDIVGGGGMWGNLGNDIGEILRISMGGEGGNIFQKLIDDAQAAAQAITNSFSFAVIAISAGFTGLAATVSVVMNSFGANAQSGAAQINAAMAAVFVNVSAGMTGLANTWSVVANSFGANARSGAQQITAALQSAMNQITSRMNQLASHWSSVCNSMIRNAKSAASSINSALQSIKNVTRTVTIRTKRINAAKGFEGLVTHPQDFRAGEGGKPEWVSVTPLSQMHTPGGTFMNTIRTPNPQINNNPIDNNQPITVQVFLDGEQVKGKVVKMIVKGQGSFR